jgi:hypothetical protein
LMVAAFDSYVVPSIFLDQLNDLAYLHRVTIIVSPKTVNLCWTRLEWNPLTAPLDHLRSSKSYEAQFIMSLSSFLLRAIMASLSRDDNKTFKEMLCDF